MVKRLCAIPAIRAGGVEIMLFDRRVHFKNCGGQPSFGVGYYCRGILPEKIIWEKLEVKND